MLGADSGAVALSVLEDGTGSYPLPTGVDLAAYGTVDVSLEPSTATRRTRRTRWPAAR